ncbi:MAG TPA: hypothetical protein VN772_04995 [Solirubrobacteraceae bacterium]|nr:hypothetical protein [Solirubrobacteraceae bacterium]
MTAILWSWAVAAAVVLALASLLGTLVKLKPGPLGLLIDTRGRYSLNHLQLVVWSIVVISLIAGVFFGRLIEGVEDPLGFVIPDRVLGLLGISVGAAVTVGAVKATKSATSAKAEPPTLASYQVTQRTPFLGQVFLVEEGEFADEVVDATKFQSFLITIVLVVAYVAMAINAIVNAKTAGAVTTLPDISGTFLVLLGISYAGYAGGKLPSQTGAPAPAPPAAPPSASGVPA